MAEGVVVGVAQDLPVLSPGLVPLPQLAELIAHKVQHFARVHRHIQVEGPSLGKFAVVIAVHLLQDGGLAVDVLVVREGQDIVLVVKIHHGEGQLALVLGALLRSLFEVVQGIVHPAQVPLVVKAQTAVLHRSGDLGIVGAVLRNEHGGGMTLLEAGVHGFEEFQRAAVDAPGRVPLPVDQAADCIHPQAVGVEVPQPVVGAGLHKAADLSPGVHEVAAAPLTLPHRVGGVLVQRGAVKTAQAVGVHRKVHRHKVQDDAHPRPVAGVDEAAETLRRTVAAGGGVKARDLVAPAAVKGVLGQGHELNVGVAVLPGIGGQAVGQLIIAQPAAVLPPLPASGVDLVDAEGGVKIFGAAGHPVPVGKRILRQPSHNAAAVGAQGHGKAIGIAVVHRGAVGAGHPVGVRHAPARTGDNALPHAADLPAALERCLPFRPVPRHAHSPGRGCPYSKARALRPRMGSQNLIGIKSVTGVKVLYLHTCNSSLFCPRCRGRAGQAAALIL